MLHRSSELPRTAEQKADEASFELSIAALHPTEAWSRTNLDLPSGNPAWNEAGFKKEGGACKGHAIRHVANKPTKQLVPEVRFELTHPLGRRILNPLRLPFRHSGTGLDYPAPAYASTGLRAAAAAHHGGSDLDEGGLCRASRWRTAAGT